MDGVPVKIGERYKPPPSVYQLPQSIANRLKQEQPHYENQPEYQYDFQLERSVLNKAQRWRQIREQQKDEREARARKRAVELEARQKEMLGAVEYPSAAELSSGSDDEVCAGEVADTTKNVVKTQTNATTATTIKTTMSISGAESRDNGCDADAVTLEPKSINSCNFNTILQPTVLSGVPQSTTTTLHKRNSSLNYADFEYNMNSTPFDNIELKTINDLDILAQVLHNTQLNAQNVDDGVETSPSTSPATELPLHAELTVTTLAETKAALESVNFHSHCDEQMQDVDHIPASDNTQPQCTPNSNSYANIYQSPTQLYNTTLPLLQQSHHTQQLQTYHMGYNQQYYHAAPLQQLYNNQNYLLTGQQQYVNGYGTPTHQPLPLSGAVVAVADEDAALKSKSVPDILRELKTELLQQQANKRRARNNSHNADQTPTPQHQQPSNVFNELAGPAQKLAQRISNMGFPLERVAKVVSLCGSDDKKIIEHLIPLSELMDLGFDESKISAALLKFDNNKDKALDYLIT